MRRYEKIPLKQLITQAAPRPRFELKPEQIEKLKTYAEVLMATIKIATVFTMIFVAPNAIQALTLFERRHGRKLTYEQKIQKVTRAFRYLKQKGAIRITKKGDDYMIKLTKFGKKQIRQLDLKTISVNKPKHWDKHFWQVAADIPTEEYKWAADLFRRKLKDLNFYPLQRTLWYYPFDPQVEIEFITRSFGIFPFVTTMKIAEMDQADYRVIKRYFRIAKII